jgi:hypothetical protein
VAGAEKGLGTAPPPPIYISIAQELYITLLGIFVFPTRLAAHGQLDLLPPYHRANGRPTNIRSVEMRKDGEGRLDKERKNVKETRENKTNRKNWGKIKGIF